MKEGFLKVAVGTPRVAVADCRRNGEETLGLIREMAEKKAKLMVFPELGLTGYTCGDLFWQETLLEAAKAELLRLAQETAQVDALIFLGLPLVYELSLIHI